MEARIKRPPARAIVSAAQLVCRDCGHVIQVGESLARCRACGGKNISLEKDPNRSVVLKCSA